MSLRSFRFLLAPLFIVGAFFFSVPQSASALVNAQTSLVSVVFADLDGIVGVPLEEYVENVFGSISGRDTILVFRLDTPGGLVSSMSRIMSLMAEANHPVVVWVAPSGASATSAGAFIVQAAHVAVMAPNTNIGAAHPVIGIGRDIGDSDMNLKITNDLAAKIRAFAEERGRNIGIVESMVRESVSLTAQEALQKNIIDFIAADEAELMKKLDGLVVKVKGEQRTLSLKNYLVTHMEMPARLRLLEIFSRPDVAYLALLAGVFLIIMELRSPGGFMAGLIGAIMLLLASYGLRVLPVNYVGVILLVSGTVIIIADLFIGGIGIASTAGVGAMLFGGLILFRAPGGELLRISPTLVVTTSLLLSMIFIFVMRLVYKAQRSKPSSGSEGMVGGRGIVIGGERGRPMAIIMGEYWRVEPDDDKTIFAIGDEIEVVRTDVLTLYVKLVKKNAEN